MRQYGLPLLILAMGALYIFFIPSDPLAVKLLFKLIPMWLILLYGYLHTSGRPSRDQWLLLIGLFFCMLGDGLLHWFVVGLSAFLIGHLFYAASFLTRWRFSAARLAAVAPIAAYAAWIGSHLIDALSRDGREALIVPVLLYIAVIAAMAFTAVMTGQRKAIFGSLLFLASDSILSWNMFVSDIAYAGPLIMITYYAAQFLLAGSLRGGQSNLRPTGTSPR
ncbi:lysoplasmalogenase [Paenibacillus methanolicus]|uniref:Putative membrane protein YhhN n=1 Tax=Paenibacillus methanolicus TaxID=582686 RepID=A0A5S5BQA6_9BACL|nr:lysoplasmalogenase [Paenibacillus methanolicus]TYP69381.1 putative membrane protein YhhN [Paenibacillus methanolicus]